MIASPPLWTCILSGEAFEAGLLAGTFGPRALPAGDEEVPGRGEPSPPLSLGGLGDRGGDPEILRGARAA